MLADVNERLEQMTGAHITAKDFRTRRGTLAAFTCVEAWRDGGSDPEPRLVATADTTADVLGNTRAVARAHYIHPRVLDAFADGTLEDKVKAGGGHRMPDLGPSERRLFGFLNVALDSDMKTAAVDLG